MLHVFFSPLLLLFISCSRFNATQEVISAVRNIAAFTLSDLLLEAKHLAIYQAFQHDEMVAQPHSGWLIVVNYCKKPGVMIQIYHKTEQNQYKFKKWNRSSNNVSHRK